MATAKIATLLIRTIAKPIATQLKSQAAQHDTFKKICVNLAQGMHRTEMALRSNLMGGTASHTKVRPLNERKAIENGATAISEGFLFAIAAALIVGESYRSSSSNRKQRDRTELAVEEIRDAIELLGGRVGLARETLWKNGRPFEDAEVEGEQEVSASTASLDALAEGDQAGSSSSDVAPSAAPTTSGLDAARSSDVEADRERLQHAVAVLLRLALKSGWIEGSDALRLDQILQTGNAASVAGSASTQDSAASQQRGGDRVEATTSDSPTSPLSSSTDEDRGAGRASTTATTAESPRSHIISEAAKARAAAIAREVREGRTDSNSSSLVELLERAGLGDAESDSKG